jgi:Icc-related predicted phosphoesterase
MLPNGAWWAFDQEKEAKFQERWIKRDPYTPYIENKEAPIIVLRGNHDYTWLEPLFPDMHVIELGNPKNYTLINGLKIGGFRGIRRLGGRWMDEYYAGDLDDRARMMPKDLDIVLTHTPPRGHLDQTWNGEHPGCDYLAEYIGTYQPKLVCCGHIHEAAGMKELGGTLLSNAADTVNVINLEV